jgi:hypothetical protein
VANAPELVITLIFDKESAGRVTLAFTAGVAAPDAGAWFALGFNLFKVVDI